MNGERENYVLDRVIIMFNFISTIFIDVIHEL